MLPGCSDHNPQLLAHDACLCGLHGPASLLS
ncbi:hypothetical protein LINGRAHAP2_LOCUS11891 [Linum grandiflorum]